MQQWHKFLQEQGFSISSQGGVEFSQPQHPTQSPNNTFVTELSNYGTLALAGPDSHKFLQGQITCNLDQLSDQKILRGAYCTPKGSVIANFDVLEKNQQVLLHMAKDVVARVQTAMSKYIVFSNATLDDQSCHWVKLGLWGDNALEVAQTLANVTVEHKGDFEAGFIYASQTNKRFIIYCQPLHAKALWQKLTQAAKPAATCVWEAEQIADGVLYVSDTISESYVPQMLNLQEIGAIDFQKGCYTGQEVVARMQYLGKLKRHLHIGKIFTSAPVSVGLSIDAQTRNSVGRITSLAQIDDGSYHFSAVINIKDANDSSLKVSGVADSKITLSSLPYEIDEQVFERIKL